MSDLRIYLDTSAYLAILLGESEAEEIQKTIKSVVLCSSTFLFLEAERNLVRLVREKKVKESIYEAAYDQLKNDFEILILRDFTPDLCLTKEFPPAKTPRSSDLIHLRTAAWFQRNGGLVRFLTLDSQQRSAAKDLGLPV